MKNQRKNMIIFICLLIYLSNSFIYSNSELRRNRKYKSTTDPLKWEQEHEEFEILEQTIKKMISEQDSMEQQFELYTKKINSGNITENDPNNIAEAFKLMKEDFSKAKIKSGELSKYIKDVNLQLLTGKQEDKAGFEKYTSISNERKKYGVSLVNQLMRQFLFTDKTRSTLKKLDDLFSSLPVTLPKQSFFGKLINGISTSTNNYSNSETNSEKVAKNKRSKRRNTKKKKNKKFRVESETNQFSRLRVQSSYRIEETVNNIYIEEAEGEDIIRAAFISMMSAVPSNFCWVHENTLALPNVVCPGNMKRKGSICHDECEEDQTEIGGLCLSSCPENYTDCNLLCSKSDCENSEDFILKKFKIKQFDLDAKCPKGYVKKNNLCYPVCEEIGLYTCSDRTCAIEKRQCKKGLPMLESGVLKAFIEYLGHIYTIKSGQNFGWSNPEALDKAKKIMGMKYYGNFGILKQIANNSFKTFRKIGISQRRKEIYEKNLGLIANSFFKTKDNTPLKTIFEWTDFSKVVGRLIQTFASNFVDGKSSTNNKGENWDACKISNFKKEECLKRFQNFVVNTTPYYLVNLIGFISKPICGFELNYNNY
jgi:hypothetical protein